MTDKTIFLSQRESSPAPSSIQSTSSAQSQTPTSSSGLKTTVEQIIIKSSNNKNQAIVPLTKDQIDAVLKSLKVPVPIKKSEQTMEESPSSTVQTLVVGNAIEAKRPSASSDAESSAKKIRLQFPSPPTDDEITIPKRSGVLNILRIDGKEKPSPQRALIPDFLNTQSVNAQVNSTSQRVGSLQEDLAFPFMDSEESNDSAPVHCGNVMQMQKTPNMQSITVQLPHKQPTILQFPVVQMPTQPRTVQQHVHTPGLSQPMQVLQGVPVSATGFTGQPINFIVPVTFSPPLTPHTPSAQAAFSFTNQMASQSQVAQNNANYTTVQYVPSSMSAQNVNISPIVARDSQSIPQLVTPTERPLAPPSKFFGNTPGGLIPLSTISAVAANMNGKEPYSTARKLDLPDIISA